MYSQESSPADPRSEYKFECYYSDGVSIFHRHVLVQIFVHIFHLHIHIWTYICYECVRYARRQKMRVSIRTMYPFSINMFMLIHLCSFSIYTFTLEYTYECGMHVARNARKRWVIVQSIPIVHGCIRDRIQPYDHLWSTYIQYIMKMSTLSHWTQNAVKPINVTLCVKWWKVWVGHT